MLRDGARCGYYLDQARSERPTSEGMSIIRPREKLRDMSRNSFFKLQRNSITHTYAATPIGQSSTLSNAHMRENVNAGAGSFYHGELVARGMIKNQRKS